MDSESSDSEYEDYYPEDYHQDTEPLLIQRRRTLPDRQLKPEEVQYISRYGSIPQKIEALTDSNNLRFKGVYDADPWDGICIFVMLGIIGYLVYVFIVAEE